MTNFQSNVVREVRELHTPAVLKETDEELAGLVEYVVPLVKARGEECDIPHVASFMLGYLEDSGTGGEP
jgi:hypothetical protein